MRRPRLRHSERLAWYFISDFSCVCGLYVVRPIRSINTWAADSHFDTLHSETFGMIGTALYSWNKNIWHGCLLGRKRDSVVERKSYASHWQNQRARKQVSRQSLPDFSVSIRECATCGALVFL